MSELTPIFEDSAHAAFLAAPQGQPLFDNYLLGVPDRVTVSVAIMSVRNCVTAISGDREVFAYLSRLMGEPAFRAAEMTGLMALHQESDTSDTVIPCERVVAPRHWYGETSPTQIRARPYDQAVELVKRCIGVNSTLFPMALVGVRDTPDEELPPGSQDLLFVAFVRHAVLDPAESIERYLTYGMTGVLVDGRIPDLRTADRNLLPHLQEFMRGKRQAPLNLKS